MLRAALLSTLPGIRHAFFTREGGVSEGVYASLNGGIGSDDPPANVAGNRARMAAALGVAPAPFITAYQIHPPTVLTAERPWVVAFAFGLLHGLGFAGVLSELGLPRAAFLPALLSFNVGVEAGQLAVIGLALLAVGLFRHRSWYRPAVVVPASCLIAAVGLYWSVQRVFF